MFSFIRFFITPIILLGAVLTTVQAQVIFKGTVIDNFTKQPLVGASISLIGTSLGTVSDEEGQYYLELKALEQGDYQLEYYFLGYEPEILSFSYDGSKTSHVFVIALKQSHYTLTEIKVSALSGGYINPDVRESAPFSFSTLSKANLELRNLGQDVPFLLKFTPAAVVNSDAGTGIGYTGIRIRGSDGTRTNVTINGVPLNDAESQGTFWVDLPDFATSVQNLQIQRGVGLSTNGAGAFGAGVHLQTLEKNSDAYFQSGNTIGSFNTIKNNIAFNTGLINEHFTFNGRLSRIQSDGYIDRATADLQSHYLHAGWWGEKANIQALLFHGHEETYQAWFGLPVQYKDDTNLQTYNPAGLKADGTFHPNQVDNYRQTHYQLHFRNQLGLNWNSHIGLHYTRGLGYFEEYKDRVMESAIFSPEASFAFYGLENITVGGDTITETNLIRRRWLDNHFFGGVWNVDYSDNRLDISIGGAASLYIGNHNGEIIWAEYASNSEQGYRYYDADADKTDINVYTRVQYDVGGNWDLFGDLQLRKVVYNWQNLAATMTNVKEYFFFNPKFGVSFRWHPDLRSYLSVAMANREPGRFDFLDAGSGSFPKPEKLLNVEGGFEVVKEGGSLLVNAYYMYYRDQLALTGAINQDALPVRVNIPKSYRYGVEISGAKRLHNKWQLEGSLAVSQNKIQSFTEFIDNWDTGEQDVVEHRHTDLAFSPPLVAHAGLSYSFFKSKKWDVDGRILSKYVGRQFLDNTSRKIASLDPYFYSDFQLTCKVKIKPLESITINLLIRNLFNQRYSPNGWIYRYNSTYDGRDFDPYAQLENGNTYSLVGLYPQAGRNILLGFSMKI